MLFTLMAVQMNGSKCNSVEYTYRPDGLRLSKNVDNNTNRSYYVWSGDNARREIARGNLQKAGKEGARAMQLITSLEENDILELMER